MTNRNELVLAVYPNARGFAFVLFEGEESIVDWGIADATGEMKRALCLSRVERLLAKYRPDVLVHREMSRSRHADLDRQFADVAARNEIQTTNLSRQQIRGAFSTRGKVNRHTIAASIVLRFPQFGLLDPGPRRIWNSEDRRAGLFDAASLGLAYFASR